MSVSASALAELHRIHKQLGDLRERKDRGPEQIKARESIWLQLTEELAKLQAEHKAARFAAIRSNCCSRAARKRSKI